MMKRKILIVAGPTAVGKTEAAIEIARRFDGEIISADSMQIYKYMDIGSAKPTAEERAQAVHHLVDVIDPAQPFSAAQYQTMAREAIEDVFSREKLPVISGGTGLYINSLLYDMDFSTPPGAAQYRRELEELARTEGREALHQRLRQQDPQAAERIHPHNVHRVVRALEILHQGESRVRDFSESLRPTQAYEAAIIGLDRPRSELYDRINRRVDLLMEAGLVEEVRGLLSMGLKEENISMKGIGYKEIIGYLHGEYGWDEAVELIKKNTRHYAKRQLTWFRRYPGIRWFTLDGNRSMKENAAPIFAWIEEEWNGE